MKKFLSVFMSCVVMCTSFGGVANGRPSEDPSSYTASAKCNRKKKSYWDKHPDLSKFLKIGGIVGVCLAGERLVHNFIREARFLGNCDFLSKHPEKMDKNLTKIEGQTMERQQGSGWCWNACLTRALYKQGLKDVTQKKVYRAMGGSRWWVSPWKHKRDQGAKYVDKKVLDKKSHCAVAVVQLLFNPVWLDQIESGVEKISNGRLKHQTVYLPWEILGLKKFKRIYSARIATKALRSILNKVRENNKDAILVTVCPFGDCCHAVTIEDIDDKQVIFGEPTTGLLLGLPCDKFFSSEKSSLRDKFPEEDLDFPNGLPINVIVEKGKELSNEWVQKMIADVINEVKSYTNCGEIAA